MANSKTTKEQLLKEYNSLLKQYDLLNKKYCKLHEENTRMQHTFNLTKTILDDYALMSKLELTSKFKAVELSESYVKSLFHRTKRFRQVKMLNSDNSITQTEWRKFPDGNLICIRIHNNVLQEIWFMDAKELK